MKNASKTMAFRNQNIDRQLECLKQFGIDVWYTEKVSGKGLDRTELQRLLEEMKPGDIVYIHDLSRLARSTKDLLDLLDCFQQAHVSLRSVKESFEMDSAMGKLFATVIGAINEFERDVLLERQREGIAIAKAQHRFKGGVKKHVDKGYFEKCLADYNCRRINKDVFCKRLGVSSKTLNRLLMEYETGVDENGNPGRFK